MHTPALIPHTHNPSTSERELPFLMNRPATNLGLTVANLSLMKSCLGLHPSINTQDLAPSAKRPKTGGKKGRAAAARARAAAAAAARAAAAAARATAAAAWARAAAAECSSPSRSRCRCRRRLWGPYRRRYRRRSSQEPTQERCGGSIASPPCSRCRCHSRPRTGCTRQRHIHPSRSLRW